MQMQKGQGISMDGTVYQKQVEKFRKMYKDAPMPVLLDAWDRAKKINAGISVNENVARCEAFHDLMKERGAV